VRHATSLSRIVGEDSVRELVRTRLERNALELERRILEEQMAKAGIQTAPENSISQFVFSFIFSFLSRALLHFIFFDHFNRDIHSSSFLESIASTGEVRISGTPLHIAAFAGHKTVAQVFQFSFSFSRKIFSLSF